MNNTPVHVSLQIYVRYKYSETGHLLSYSLFDNFILKFGEKNVIYTVTIN